MNRFISSEDSNFHMVRAQKHRSHSNVRTSIRFSLGATYEVADGQNSIDQGQCELPDSTYFELHPQIRLRQIVLRDGAGIDEDTSHASLCGSDSYVEEWPSA